MDTKPDLIVPYSLTRNDSKFLGSIGTADEWFTSFRDGLEVFCDEGVDSPKMMSLGLHLRIIDTSPAPPGWPGFWTTSPPAIAFG